MRNGFLIISICCLLSFGVAGCEEGFFAGGAASGITLDHWLEQAEADVIENIELLNQRNAELEQLIGKTEDAAEKAKLRSAIESNKALQEKMATGLDAIRAGRQGLGTNWQDPVAISGYAAFLASLVGNFLQRRKKNALSADLLATNAAVEKFKSLDLADVEARSKLYDTIKEARRAAGVI
jgi:hypothetical protein